MTRKQDRQRCHDRCQCLCHDTSGQVNPHRGSTCPGKWDMPVEKRNEAVDVLEAVAFGLEDRDAS